MKKFKKPIKKAFIEYYIKELSSKVKRALKHKKQEEMQRLTCKEK
jgi:hypothetical protein